MEKFLLPFFDGAVPTELAADYILPDTYPDVKRILRVRARPMPLGHFVNAGRLEFTGAVDYIVTFSSESDEGPDRLHAVHFASEYSGTVIPEDGSKLSEACEITLSPSIASCSARLQNPRKLSLRSTVVTDAKLAGYVNPEPRIDGLPTVKLERLTEKARVLLDRSIVADHRQINENLEPDPSQPAIDEIITCDAELHFREAKPQIVDGNLTVAVKGEAMVDCVYRAQSEIGDCRSFTRRIPLAFSVDAADCGEFFKESCDGSLCAIALGAMTELNASVGENGYGERRVIELDLSFDVTLKLFADTETELTLDAYSVERESECTARKLELCSLAKALSSNFSVSESVNRDSLGLADEPEAGYSIVDSQADIRMNSASVERGRAQLVGEATVSCILFDRRSFTPVEFKVPLKCELSVGDLSEPIDFICDCAASDLRVRIDPGRISCDFETSLNVVFLRRKRLNAVDSVKLAPDVRPSSRSRSDLTLCYPLPGESLWSVAKRHNTTTSAISALNPSLPDSPHVLIV